MEAFSFTRSRQSRLWKKLNWNIRAAMSPRDGIDRALAKVLRYKWKKKTMRFVFSHMENPETAEIGRLLFGVAIARSGNLDSAFHAFAVLPDETLTRYALPEAAAALATSDPNRVQALLQNGRERWTQFGFRLSHNRRFSLATTSAYLGDAEGVEFFTVGLCHPGTDELKRRFAAQCRTARHLGVKADYPSVRAAALSVAPTGAQKTDTTTDRTQLVETLEPDFPLAVAAEGPVWLLARGSFGKEVYPGYYSTGACWHGPVDFPFSGNVRPLFLEFHIADLEILDDASLAYLRRFAPIGCRDLFTARLLRGAGVEAFIGESELPQSISEAVLEGQSEAKVCALWSKATAPAVVRTNALIAEVNAKYPLPEVRVADLRLNRVPVRSFGPKGDTKDNDTVQLLFNFDDNQAQFFPGAFDGIWRYATRPLVVHVFGRGLTADMFEGWTAQFPGTRFVWRDLSNMTLGDARLEDHITVSSWDRLLAPALLPEVEKIVYLDVDILVRKDISELFDLELGDAPLAAKRINLVRNFRTGVMQVQRYDGDSRFTEDRREALRNAFFSGETVFEGFNAGVLVMNLAQMRRERAVEKTLAIVRASGVGDQLALNLYARGRRKPLADEWNTVPDRGFSEEPAIIHFAGPLKPWSTDLPVPFAKEWRENARKVASR